MRKQLIAITALVLATALVTACSQKAPAEAALKAAQTAVDGVRDQGSNYAPAQFKDLQASLAAAQESFNKGDYKAALDASQAIPAKANDVAAAAAAKKTELTKAWSDMAAGVPQMSDDIKAKIDAYGAMKKLPAGMDAAKVTAAKEGFASAQAMWSEASEASKAGKLNEALAKGKAAKDKGAEVLAMLTPTPPVAPAKPAAKPAAKKAK